MMVLFLLHMFAPPPAPTPIWEEARPHSTLFTVHRVIGYTLLGTSLVQSGLGWATLSAYESGNAPSELLRTTHRVLGYGVVSLAAANALLGSWNLLSMDPQKRRRKHYVHALFSWTATALYVTAGVFAYQARTLPEFDRYYAHRNAALAATGATLLTVGVVIW